MAPHLLLPRDRSSPFSLGEFQLSFNLVFCLLVHFAFLFQVRRTSLWWRRQSEERSTDPSRWILIQLCHHHHRHHKLQYHHGHNHNRRYNTRMNFWSQAGEFGPAEMVFQVFFINPLILCLAGQDPFKGTIWVWFLLLNYFQTGHQIMQCKWSLADDTMTMMNFMTFWWAQHVLVSFLYCIGALFDISRTGSWETRGRSDCSGL